MVRRFKTPLRPLLLLGAVVASGCSPRAARTAWVETHGGIVTGRYQPRAQQALDSLPPEGRSNGVTVTVLDTNQVGAFAWRTGHVFVTRALVELLEEDELAAAVAHEVGHLLAEHDAPQVTSLQGAACDLNEESQADLVAVRLLRASGQSGDSVVRMLEKITRVGDIPESTRRALRDRIRLLRSGIRPVGGP